MKNKMVDMRNHLMATLEDLRDLEKSVDLDRAYCIAAVSQVLVNSVRVEVDFLRVTDSVRGTGFLPSDAEENPAIPGEAIRFLGQAKSDRRSK